MATEAETAIEAIETTSLDAKLSQLQAVSHARDKHLREEREQRHRQMEMLQKDVANMPAEAVAHLVGADYTLCKFCVFSIYNLINYIYFCVLFISVVYLFICSTNYPKYIKHHIKLATGKKHTA